MPIPNQVPDRASNQNFEEVAKPQVALPVLGNGWVAKAGYYAPRIYKTVDQMVTIVAVLNGAAATNVGVFTLPEGYRPLGLVQAACLYWTGAAWAMGAVDVQNTGAVRLFGNNGLLVTADYFSPNITFSTYY